MAVKPPCSRLGLGEEAPVGEEGVGIDVEQPPPALGKPGWPPGLAPARAKVGCAAGEQPGWQLLAVTGRHVALRLWRRHHRGWLLRANLVFARGQLQLQRDVDADSYCPDL
jgi:hypothetical protein